MLPAGLLLQLTQEAFPRRLAQGVIGIQPVFAADGKASVLQALLHRDEIVGIHFARAGAALHGAPGTAAEEGDLPCLTQREVSAPLQKQGAFRPKAPHPLPMFHFIILQLHVVSSPRYRHWIPCCLHQISITSFTGRNFTRRTWRRTGWPRMDTVFFFFKSFMACSATSSGPYQRST